MWRVARHSPDLCLFHWYPADVGLGLYNSFVLFKTGFQYIGIDGLVLLCGAG